MRNLDGPAGAIDWIGAVDQALFAPDGIRLAFQPIVDLRRATVAGYEVLARFDVPGLPSAPMPWLTAARDQGRLAALEQTVLVKALEARCRLGPNVFLSVNVSAGVLLESTTAALFAGAGDLRGVVIEITEHDRVLDYDALRDAFAPTREAGAMLGVDDAGAGYASLGHVLALRPEFVKLDRALVADLDHEHGRRAAVAAVGALAGELDGWLVAEGIERAGELDALVSLDVPLGQGYILGRPEHELADVPAEVVAQLRTATLRRRDDQPVRSLVQDVPMRPADAGWASLLEEAAAAAAPADAGWPAGGGGLGNIDGEWQGPTSGLGQPEAGWPDRDAGLGSVDAGWPGVADSSAGALAVPPLGADRPGTTAVPPVVVLVDEHGAPVALELDGRPAAWGPRPMTVLAGEPVSEVALRCTNRPAEERLLPVVCCDGRGRALGMVTVDALLHALARERAGAARP